MHGCSFSASTADGRRGVGADRGHDELVDLLERRVLVVVAHGGGQLGVDAEEVLA